MANTAVREVFHLRGTHDTSPTEQDSVTDPIRMLLPGEYAVVPRRFTCGKDDHRPRITYGNASVHESKRSGNAHLPRNCRPRIRRERT